MGKVLQLSAKLSQLTVARFNEEVLASIERHEGTVRTMVTDQLFQGEDGTGKKMPPYSDRSVTVFGKPNGPWRGYETGDLYNRVFADTSKFPVLLGSSSDHAVLFAEKLENAGYNSDDTYKLQQQNLTDLAKSYVLPDIQKFFRNFIHV